MSSTRVSTLSSPDGALRAVAIAFGLATAGLTAGFLFQAPWATNLWPWLAKGHLADPGLSSIFLASIAIAIATPTLWIGLTARLGAATGGAINLLITFGGTGAFLLNYYRREGDQFAIVGGLVCIGSVLVLLAVLRMSSLAPRPYSPPMPLPVRLSFGLFTALLITVGLLLLTNRQNVYPWWLNAETGALYGWIYLGAASYFLYGMLDPRWENACGQLLGFLAYDLVLLPPFLAHFATVAPARRLSLTVYTAVLVYSAVLACIYLFIRPSARWWQHAEAVQ